MNRISTVFVFLLISYSSFGQTQDPVAYLNVIGEQFQKINHEVMTYTSAVNHGKSARKVEKRRGELIQQVKDSETAVRKLKPFNGVTTLRDSMSSYFRMTGIVLNQEYGKIVNMEEVAEQSYDAMETYLLAKERAEAKLDVAEENARVQYEAFAGSNNIKLIKGAGDELDRKLEKTGKVNQYANKAYLLFFKSYKNEYNMMDAINKGDIPAIEQSRNALASSSAEDLLKVAELAPFNGDATLKTAVQKALVFYKEEAEAMKVEADFSISKQNYEKIKKSFDSTPSSKRTQDNIDTYNKAVDDFNKRVASYNAVHQEMNKKRSAANENWNKSYDAFVDKHTPRYK